MRVRVGWRVLCRRVGLYVRTAGSARRGCGAGAGLENQNEFSVKCTLQ